LPSSFSPIAKGSIEYKAVEVPLFNRKLTGYFVEEEKGPENEYNMIHTDFVFKF